jgi:acetyl esterase/lipase
VSEEEIGRFDSEQRRRAARQPTGRRSPRVPEGVEVLRDVVYGTAGGRELKLDIYRPDERPAGAMPVLVWIHGGAWRAGDKRTGGARVVPFAAKGYFCASINYRLTGEAAFPAQVEDCKCAVRYLRAHAAEYGIDPERIGVWGSSAGGHLVAMLGTTGGVGELEGEGGWAGHSSRVQAVCDWYGPSDLLAMADQPSNMNHDGPGSPEGAFLGGSVKANPAKARRASPVTYVDADDPPFLIMHGTRDMTVPFGQSEILHAALRDAGVDVTFRPVEGAGHGGPGFGSDEALGLVTDFFAKHLAPGPPRKRELGPKRDAPSSESGDAPEPDPPDAPAPEAAEPLVASAAATSEDAPGPLPADPVPGSGPPSPRGGASLLPWVVAGLVTVAAGVGVLLWLRRSGGR